MSNSRSRLKAGKDSSQGGSSSRVLGSSESGLQEELPFSSEDLKSSGLQK